MINDNDILDITLRNRFNRDVELLTAEIRRLRDKINGINDALAEFPVDAYHHLDTSVEWNALCDLVDE
jgi:hypothetical protein